MMNGRRVVTDKRTAFMRLLLVFIVGCLCSFTRTATAQDYGFVTSIDQPLITLEEGQAAVAHYTVVNTGTAPFWIQDDSATPASACIPDATDKAYVFPFGISLPAEVLPGQPVTFAYLITTDPAEQDPKADFGIQAWQVQLDLTVAENPSFGEIPPGSGLIAGFDVRVNDVPEPGMYVLCASFGLTTIACLRRRRSR